MWGIKAEITGRSKRAKVKAVCHAATLDRLTEPKLFSEFCSLTVNLDFKLSFELTENIQFLSPIPRFYLIFNKLDVYKRRVKGNREKGGKVCCPLGKSCEASWDTTFKLFPAKRRTCRASWQAWRSPWIWSSFLTSILSPQSGTIPVVT